jgi:site-specific DNA-methyltransferase (adenine-specific)
VVANIDLLLTDPPYNVDYTGKTKDSLKIKNDKMAEDDFERFLVSAFRAADSVMRPGAAFYIWHASGPIALNFMTAAKQVWPIRQTLIWVKNTMVLGHSDYHYKHEPCLYGWKVGADRFFAPTRRETTVVEDQIDPDKMSKKELQDFVRQMLTEDQIDTTVLHEDKPTRSELHPTMKPIKLMARLIRNSSQEGDAVLDPFGGSGSTLIACEQMNRRCFTAELDPKYAQTIIDRWEAFTGKKAVRI